MSQAKSTGPLLQRHCLKVSKLLGPCTSTSVTETTSTSSELLEGESSVRGMLDQLNSGMFLNCNVNVNVNCKEWLFLSWKSINICSRTAFFWKLISKHTCLDILTSEFGYLITRVWICSLRGIKEYPCDSNEALCIINEFQKTCSHTRAIRLEDKFLISVRPCNILYFILEVFFLFEILKSYWPKRGICELTLLRWYDSWLNNAGHLAQ